MKRHRNHHRTLAQPRYVTAEELRAWVRGVKWLGYALIWDAQGPAATEYWGA